ncbi:MAG: glycosyl hydrolase [Myxococcales bacterium]|nr:glycosyl hydrolase [Myxococcales bacterium]
MRAAGLALLALLAGCGEEARETGPRVRDCRLHVRFAPAGQPGDIGISSDFNGFDASRGALRWDGEAFSGAFEVAPGRHLYRVEVDGRPFLDPDNPVSLWEAGAEWSVFDAPDCARPAFTLAGIEHADGAPSARLVLERADAQSGLATVQAFVDDAPVAAEVDGDEVRPELRAAPGKHHLRLEGTDAAGRPVETFTAPYWAEAERFRWEDAVIYQVVLDRFARTTPFTPADRLRPPGERQGGDLRGLLGVLESGYFETLGVDALWISPLNTNPEGLWTGVEGGPPRYSSYHGYWPIAPRAVDPRLGTDADVEALVQAAHARGIRVLLDLINNQVHEQHEYVGPHPDWFRTACVCGLDPGCGWSERPLDCLFAPYLPDINWRVAGAEQQFISDAVWWIETFGVDGFRVDAVKHVEEAATRNLAAAVREGFEPAGTRYFLMGETAMGWSDCPDPCNDENYGTISKYVGPLNLDGQFDFVLYHAVSYNTFAYGNKGMLHAAYWLEHGLEKWPDDAVMTPYIGSHDTPRFVSLADYRGQDGAHDPGVAHSQWDNVAEAPGDPEPYRRARIGMAWLLGLPGAPLLYYGDEYGQWGGADPNNRQMWRSEDALNPDESQTLDFVRQLGAARSNIPALRVGTYVALDATEDSIVFGRHLAGGESAVVAVTRADQAQQLSVNVSESLGLAPGTVLADALGGPDATVSVVGNLIVNIPPSGAVILAP